MLGFRARLAKQQEELNTLVCGGLDPLAENLPKHLLRGGIPLANAVGAWMQEIALAIAPCVCMLKLQIAHWEAIPNGVGALEQLIREVHHQTNMPIFLDCKRGDIARTQKQYGVAAFDQLGADGMNFSPYMGKDCMAALADKEKWPGKALVGLCYTSNPTARQVQDALMADGRPSWEHYAEWILQWAEELGVVENAGLVMAAAYGVKAGDKKTIYSAHLTRCRELVGDKLWYLIPGIGAQGGFIEETARTAYRGPGSIAISSSSEICFASAGEDFAEAAAQKAKALRDSINNAIAA